MSQGSRAPRVKAESRKWRCLPVGVSGGRAREVGKPRRATPLPRINTPGREQGDGFPGGIEPLKRQCEAERFCGKAQERKGRRKRRPDHPGGEKALKGEAHERWRLKEISKEVEAERHVKRRKGEGRGGCGLSAWSAEDRRARVRHVHKFAVWLTFRRPPAQHEGLERL